MGGGPSGNDLVSDATSVAKSVIHATSGGKRSSSEAVHRRTKLVSLDTKNHLAVYDDGTSDSDVDMIMLATGYELTFPFLSDEISHIGDRVAISLSDELRCSTSSIFPLARQTFPLRSLPPRSIAFVGLPVKLAPFPAAECQALAIAAVFFDNPESDEEPVWDQEQEEALVSARLDALIKRFGGAYGASKNWHRLFSASDSAAAPVEDSTEEQLEDWDAYRTSLLRLAARDRVDADTRMTAQRWTTRPWERWMYDEKVGLRAEWVKLEREGVANDWLQGVGYGKESSVEQEWVDFARKVLAHARERAASESGSSSASTTERTSTI